MRAKSCPDFLSSSRNDVKLECNQANSGDRISHDRPGHRWNVFNSPAPNLENKPLQSGDGSMASEPESANVPRKRDVWHTNRLEDSKPSTSRRTIQGPWETALSGPHAETKCLAPDDQLGSTTTDRSSTSSPAARVQRSQSPKVPSPKSDRTLSRIIVGLLGIAGVSSLVVATVAVYNVAAHASLQKQSKKAHISELDRLNKINNPWNGHPNNGLLTAE